MAISAFRRVSQGCRQISSALITARQGIAQQCPATGRCALTILIWGLTGV